MKTLIISLIPFLRPHRNRIYGSIFFALCMAAIKAMQVKLVKPIFDKGLSNTSTFNEAMLLAGILLLLGILNFPCRFFHFYWIRYVVDQSTCDLRQKIYAKMQRLPMSYFAQNKQGVLISNLINDTQVFSQGFRNVVDVFREPMTALVMLVLAFMADWQMTLVILIVAPLFVIIFQKSGRHVRTHQGQVQEEMSHMTHVITEGLGGQKITKAFNLQDYVSKRFHEAQIKFFNATMKTTFTEEFAHPLVEVVGAIAFSGVILFAHHRIASHAITTGDFVSFVTALALLMDPIRKFSQANVKLNQARAAAGRIFSLLNEKEEDQRETSRRITFNHSLEVKNLIFSYDDHKVLNEVSFKLEKGKKIALVGLSGSGKSTIMSLLLGLYDCHTGDVLIDGVSIKNYSLNDVRSIFGLVSQDIFLFHDTIRENLTMGQRFTDAELNRALEISYAREFVDKLPAKMETVIGDRGMRLSGGQQQRLTIARAFLHNAEVLLFDEATSALDNESEKIVQQALERIAGNKTVIAVAHRLSTVQNFDRIFVMKEGRIVEEGIHQDLINKKGEYAKLYELSL